MSDSYEVKAVVEVKNLKEVKFTRNGVDRSLFILQCYVQGSNGGPVKVFLKSDTDVKNIVGFELGVYEKDGSLKLIPIFGVK
jgi:hypothetical protein